MKKIFFLILFMGIALWGRAGAEEAAYIPARDYAATALREIDGARSSVRLYLYLFGLHPGQAAGPVGAMAEALGRAAGRGVRVEVVLNRGGGAGDASQEGDNREAAEFLRSRGAAVFLSDGPLLHAKVLVVDETTVLLGSSNWTAAAFTQNREGNVLIRSTAAAAGALRDFASMQRRPFPPPEPAVLIPRDFLLAPGGAMGSLIRTDDEHGLDGYLFFLKRRAEGDADFIPDGELIRALGLPGRDPVSDRSQALQVLARLKERYGLLDFTAEEHGASVRLPGAEGDGALLPESYFRYGWDRRLSLVGKAFLLAGRLESARSPLSPRWSLDEGSITRRYAISRRSLGKAITELRRKGLIRVEYQPLTEHVTEPRGSSFYTPRDFYDPAEVERRFAAMEASYGREAVARGREIAALVYDDSDADAVETFISLERERGKDVVDKALALIGAKQPTNPKRSAGYLIQTIRKIAS